MNIQSLKSGGSLFTQNRDTEEITLWTTPRDTAAFALAMVLLALGAPCVAQTNTNAALPTVNVSVLTLYGTSNSPAQFLFTRDGTNADLQVNYSFEMDWIPLNGVWMPPAHNGYDFQALSGQLVIPTGTNAAVLNIYPLNDGDGVEGLQANF